MQPPPNRSHFLRWLVLALTLFLCIGAASSPSFWRGFNQGLKPMIDAMNNVAASHQTPTPGVTSGVGYGHTQIGSSMGDFIAEYGPPTKTAPGSDVFTSGNVQITAYATGSVVYQISVTGPSSWTSTDAQAFCHQFLPDDASESSHTSTAIEYQSSIGQITMQIQPPTCTLFAGL